MKEFKVKCPHCSKEFPYAKNPFRPFCSERCRLLDLGQWLSEGYVIEGPVKQEDENDELDLEKNDEE